MMNAESFGLKASGICLEPYFTHGIPLSLDSVIHDLDAQLTENSNLLEQCIKEVFEMSRQMVGSEKTYGDPSEAISEVLENHILEKASCYDVDLNAIARVLQGTIKFLEAHPGSEESVIGDLLTLYSSQGLAFPTCVSATDFVSRSTLSLHAAVDQSEQVVESTWNDLCLRLRRCFVEKLVHLPVEQSPSAFSAARQNRVHYVRCLCSIFPAANVWEKYCSLRQQQVQSCLGKIGGGRKEKFSDVVRTFARNSKSVLAMIDADFDLFNSGVFAGEVDTFKGIGEIYFDVILDHVSGILEAACTELLCRDKKIEKDSKGMPKSPSDIGFLGRHLKGGLRRQQSQSMESLVGRSDELRLTGLSVVSEAVLLSLVQLVKCLLNIEGHLEEVQSILFWQFSGNFIAKKTSKTSLKSVLKGALMSGAAAEEQPANVRNGKVPYTNGGIVALEEPDALDGEASTSRVYPLIQGRLSVETSQFDWRAIFHQTFPEMGTWLRSHIHRIAEKECREESDTFDRTLTLPKSPLPPELIELDRGLPSFVSKTTLTVLDTIGQVLPLALYVEGIGNSSPVTTAYLEAVVFAAQTLNAWLNKLSHEPFDRVPVTCLHIGLANSTFLQSCLKSLEKTFKVNESSLNQSLLSCSDECQKTMDFFVETITHYHKDLIIDSILRDAQSHNWSDIKEFYEGERCSFDVQMWTINVQQLHRDLWIVCSPDHSREILLSILSESLNLFSWRYSRIQPSQRRMSQFKADISLILLCTSELLLSACDSMPHFLDNWYGSRHVAAIHESCNSLLAALSIVCCPLDVVYRYYRKGFDKHLSQSDEKGNAKSYLSQWMSWLRPTLLPLGQTSIDTLPTVHAVYLQLSLMCRQPRVLPHHVLQKRVIELGIAKPRMLVSRAFHRMRPTDSKPRFRNKEALLIKENTVSILLLNGLNETVTSKQSTSSSQRDEQHDIVENIFTAFVDVFVKCDQFHECLSNVLLAVIDSSNGWNLFDTTTIIGKTSQVPIWLTAIIKQLKAFTNRVIEPGIRLLLNKSTAVPPLMTPLSEFLNDRLPCDCHPINTSSDDGNGGVKDLVAECMYSVITQLVSDIHAVPHPVVMFFRSAQKLLGQKGVKCPFRSVGLKVLATTLRLALSNLDEISRVTGCHPMEQNFKENLNMLAECLYYVLTSSHCERGSGAPRTASLFMKANRNWMLEQVETITELFNSESIQQTNSESNENGFSDTFLHELYIAQCQSLSGSKTAQKSFAVVQNFVLNNVSWVLSQLDCSVIFQDDPLLSGTSFDASSLVLDTTLKASKSKDPSPLESYSKIGSVEFCQASLLDAKYDWARLVSADFGLGFVSFRNLLSNRPDIRDCGSVADANMRRMAEALRKKYNRSQDVSSA